MTERVRVVVRVRPFIESDPEDADLVTVVVDPTHISIGGNRVFMVDRVYQMEDSTSDIFSGAVRNLVDDFLKGFQATVMAYGQTGTGKTFTMSGLMPLILRYIVEEGFQGSTRDLSFQFIEVYGDVLRDLLSEDPANDGNEIHLYDGGALSEIGGRDCVVVGARRATAADFAGVENIIQYGTQMRATAATNIHEHSSRSHSIFTIYNHRNGGNKLHLVDLAGSERNKKTLNVGQRFKESIAINSGLLALGNVIRALGRNSPHGHVPYRSSKLTRLLQNALGGVGKTLFLGCVAPDGYNREETLRTLQYCALAVRVVNTPVAHYKALHDAQMRPFRTPSSATRRESANERENPLEEAAQKTLDFSLSSDKIDIHTELEMYRQFCLEQEAEIESLQQQLKASEDRSRVFEDELRNDQVVFTRQIAEMERVLSENRDLRQRLTTLTNGSSALSSSENGLGAKTKSLVHSPNIRPDPPHDRYNVKDDINFPTNGREKQIPHTEPITSTLGNLTHIVNGDHCKATSALTSSLPSHPTQKSNGATLTRDEQLLSLTKEALFYQTNNTELRSQLGSVVARLESQQRESALLRLELDEIHKLLNPKK
ncbi:unnamed protein product [Phytomonas sp. Hart1]|nr:unnamed protein product [Phytomonas sp. Hart1]|eukprot:CCW71177.1 unnamed protein product [Phytomonas sp. isolate Hart1]